jgi:hypothetical protein
MFATWVALLAQQNGGNSVMGGALRGALIGGAIGAVVGVVLWIVKKSRGDGDKSDKT